MLTDPQFIRKLETLYILTKKVLGGDLKADRKSKGKGSGVVFSDYAEYYPGDDYRNIDWNIYARQENLVVKLFEIEEDIRISVLMDLSHSMHNKILYAKKIAAALAYIALNNLDFLTIYGLSDALSVILEPAHGRNKIFPMLNALERADLYGSDTNFNDCIKTFQLKNKRKSVCVILSDFFFNEDYKTALDYLAWAGHDIFAIQILSPEELICDLKGDIELECIETGRKKLVTVGQAEAEKYLEELQNWNIRLQKECAKRGIGFIRTTTEIPFEQIIQDILRKGGLIA